MKSHVSTLKVLLPPLSAYLGIAAYIALKAPLEVSTFLYSESGPYEVFSTVLWLVLAGLVLLQSQLQLRVRLASSIAALLMCSRELDMHKALFTMSFIKTNFYKSPDIPFHDKVAGGLALLVMIALLVYLAKRMLLFLRTQASSDTSAHLLVYSLALGAISKILDRFSSQMHELFNIAVPANARLAIVAMEESLELALPLLLILALLTYRRRLG